MQRRVRRWTWLAAGLASVMAALWYLLPVSAHARQVRSDPADGEILTAAPPQVNIWFSEELTPQFSGAKILDLNGKEIPLNGSRVDAADSAHLILDVPPLADGTYSVNWQVHSRVDGHTTQGYFVFIVGEASGAAVASSLQTAEPSPPLIEIILRWLNYLLILNLGGALAVFAFLLPTTGEWRHGLGQAFLRLGAVAAAAAFVLGFALLAWQVQTLRVPTEFTWADTLNQLVGGTRWGALWVMRQALLLVLALFWWTGGARLPVRLVAGISGLVVAGLVWILALGSHAAALAARVELALAADFIHYLAAALWLGALQTLLLAGWLWRRVKHRNPPGVDFTALWAGFGWFAFVGVGLLWATGIYNTARQVATLDALLTTGYGRSLLLKITLALLMGLAGLFNSAALHPGVKARLERLLRRRLEGKWYSAQALPRRIALEAIFGVVLLGMVGVITASSPVNDFSFTIDPSRLPEITSGNVGDLLVTFSAQPNRPGENIMTIQAVSSRRPPPAEILRVIVRFRYLGRALGEQTADAALLEPGMYRLGGSYLSLPGPWNVEIAVRRKGMEDSVVNFRWMVGIYGKPHPKFLSNADWELPLGVLSGVVLLGVIVAAIRLRQRKV